MKKTALFLLGVISVLALLIGCENAPKPTVKPNDVPQQAVTDKSQFIGEARAKEIALEKAGIEATGVLFDRVELERDGGIWQYELEFRKDRIEYDADIKADDGKILSWDVDYD